MVLSQLLSNVFASIKPPGRTFEKGVEEVEGRYEDVQRKPSEKVFGSAEINHSFITTFSRVAFYVDKTVSFILTKRVSDKTKSCW